MFRTAVKNALRACVGLLLAAGAARAADCLPIEEAPKHVNQMKCVTGRIVRVNHGKNIWYLDFCEDYKNCPFSVVVFERDLKDAEKLKSFEGKIMRIYGPVEEYHGHTQMVLKLEQQLSGEPGPYADNLVRKKKPDPMPPVPRSAGVRRWN